MTPRLEPLELRALLSVASASPSGTSINPAVSVLLQFKPEVTATADQTELNAIHGVVAESFPDGTEVVELTGGETVAAALASLKQSSTVVYAQADSTLQSTATPVTPNDTYFTSQWGLDQSNNVDIDAPQAWSVTTGSSSVIVAVLDTGIDLNNLDFAGRLWTNPTAGSDGYVGDVHGWNFVNNTSNLQDNNGHGTHVSGILAATGNNGTGVAGVDWNARIMPLKILGSNGSGSTDAAVSAIYFAVDHGARVINASWGGTQSSQALYNAISYANSKGVVFVTAAGNDSQNSDTNTANYPASYGLPNELVVAAIDSSGNLASFSDYGANTVNLAAPGVNIWSTVPGGFASYSGTSMATPYVSGVVSLVVGEHPEPDGAGTGELDRLYGQASAKSLRVDDHRRDGRCL